MIPRATHMALFGTPAEPEEDFSDISFDPDEFTMVIHSAGSESAPDSGAVDLTFSLATEESDEFIIHWGDGFSDLVSEYTTTSHTYSEAGIYVIRIAGDVVAVSVGGLAKHRNKVRAVLSWGKIQYIHYEGQLSCFASKWVANVPNTMPPEFSFMSDLFAEATFITNTARNKIATYDVSAFDSQYNTFSNSNVFGLDLSGWDMSGVRVFFGIFAGASFCNPEDETDLSDAGIGNWDLGSAESINSLFLGASGVPGSITNWDVSNVLNFSYAFSETMQYPESTDPFSLDLSGWNTHNVRAITAMCADSTLAALGCAGWDLSACSGFVVAFSGAVNFSEDLSGWDVRSAAMASSMFANAESFSCDLTGWCVGRIASAPSNFSSGSGLTSEQLPEWGTCPLYTADTIEFIGVGTGTTSATIPAHQVGDCIIAFAYRDGSNTAPAVPADQGWINISIAGASSNSLTVVYKIAASTSEVTGTFTGSNALTVAVYRNAHLPNPIGAAATSAGTAANVTYPAVGANTWKTPPYAWVLRFSGHRSTNTSLETPPSGFTLRHNRVQGTVCEVSLFDSNGGVASVGAEAVAVGGTSSGWRSISIELIPKLSRTP